MSDSGAQRGQATVEWVGLLLGVTLMFGALVAGGREAARGESADGLGEALAERITCAARGACGAGSGALAGRPGARRGPPPNPLGSLHGGRGVPPRLAGRPGAVALRGGTGVLKRAWLLCLGWRRLRYDIDHPLSPRQAVPLRETVDMVNGCLNPLSFFFG